MLPTCFDTCDGATAIGQLASKAPLSLACSLTAGGKLSTESLTSLADYVTVSHGGSRPFWVSGGLVSRLSQIAQGVADHAADHVGYLDGPRTGLSSPTGAASFTQDVSPDAPVPLLPGPGCRPLCSWPVHIVEPHWEGAVSNV